MAQALAKARKRLTHDQRHEHLLDVAAKLMLEHGFEAVTMEAVKEHAGVSRGLTYTHFVNAEELVFALYEREMTELERRLDAMDATSRTFDERVRLATRTYFDFVADRGGLLATLQLKLPERWFKPTVRERLSRLLRHWSDEVEREFAISPALARTLARSSLAATEMLAAALRSKHLTRADAERLSTEFVLGGLRRAASHKP
jgi:AcrR family transcriptional regulator